MTDTENNGVERREKAPVVYDEDGNPLCVRLVDHVAVGEVSGEGHYGYEHKLTSEHATIYFEEGDSGEESSFFRGMKPFAAHIQGVSIGGMLGGLIGATWGWGAVGLMGVPASILILAGFAIEKQSDKQDTEV